MPWVLTAAVVLALAAAAGASPTPARYLVVELDAAGHLTPVWETRVLLDLPASPTSPEPLAVTPGGAEPSVEASLVDANGATRYRQIVRPASWLRGEFAATAGVVSPVEGHLLARDRSYFVVRVPESEGAHLVLRQDGGAPVEVAAGAVVSAGPAAVAASGATAVDVIQATGSPANRLDVLIVAEGYTAGQHAAFLADVDSLLASFFELTPYHEYRGFLNVAALFVASPEAGADHPPYRSTCAAGDGSCCPDPAASGDPRAGTFVDTAFDGQFCTLGVQRLLTVNDFKVLAAATAVPDWDLILVLVNDPTYGGSGGEMAVVSTDARATQIAQHELGHSFAQLADEYATAYPGYPGCSDVVGSAPCESNVTDEIRRDRLKWAAWVLPDTPLPTPPDDPTLATAVGMFEGARYQASGMYRPRVTCLMRELGRPLCEVCRQAFVLRLYQGGWGVPAAGIDPIDPGSESPPPGPVSTRAGEPLTFAVHLVQPASTPSLWVTWLVDGTPVTGDDGTMTWTPPHAGTYRVELVAADATGFVNEKVAVPTSRREWAVTAWSGRAPRRRLGVAAGH
jgi:hypothetical protein